MPEYLREILQFLLILGGVVILATTVGAILLALGENAIVVFVSAVLVAFFFLFPILALLLWRDVFGFGWPLMWIGVPFAILIDPVRRRGLFVLAVAYLYATMILGIYEIFQVDGQMGIRIAVDAIVSIPLLLAYIKYIIPLDLNERTDWVVRKTLGIAVGLLITGLVHLKGIHGGRPPRPWFGTAFRA